MVSHDGYNINPTLRAQTHMPISSGDTSSAAELSLLDFSLSGMGVIDAYLGC